MQIGEWQLFYQFAGVFKSFFGFAGKADDNIRPQSQSRNGGDCALNNFELLTAVIISMHGFQGFIITALQRDMQVRTELFGFCHEPYQVAINFHRID